MNFIEFVLVIILIAVGCGIFVGSCERFIHKKQSNISCWRVNDNGPATPVYRIRRTKTGCLQCSKCYKFLSKSKMIDHCPHCGCEFDWVDVENFFM